MDRKKLEEYRREFPVVENAVYLDHAGVAPVSLRVQRAVERFLRESTGRGAFHYPAWVQQIARTRQRCAELIGAEAEEIAFVKNTSHGLSLVARGLSWKPGDRMVFCGQDFPSNIYPWLALERQSVQALQVALRKGVLEFRDIEGAVDGRTRLVAVSSVQFASGSRLDLESVGALCGRRGARFCVDAIQSLGVLPTDVRRQKIDFLAADAHKWLLGPEGIGIFFCRSGLAGSMDPPLIGWKSVKNELDFDHPHYDLKDDAPRFEEGSQNLMGIIGLGAAVELLLEIGIKDIEERVQSLGDEVIGRADRRGFEVLTPRDRRERGGSVSFRGGFDPANMRDRLREQGIMVNARGGALRISPHFYNREEEIDRLFQAIDGLIR